MILDGKKVSEEIILNIKKEVEILNYKPKVIDIVIGHDEPTKLYVKNKQKACDEVGIEFEIVNFDISEAEEKIISFIEKLNLDSTVNGIMIQLPIPQKHDVIKIINTINPNKDIDGLTDYNHSKLYNDNCNIVPCTPKGILRLLDYYNIELKDKNIVIIGRSNLVGKPLFHLLLNKNANITICHSRTSNLTHYTKDADIIICAANKENLLTEEMVNSKAIVIDVGIIFENGFIIGNVEKKVYEKVEKITPVPGGVGPMTIAMFLENILLCCKNSE